MTPDEAERRGLAAWLPDRCRCGPHAQLAFTMVVAVNASLQVRLRCDLCGVEGVKSVPHVHVNRTDPVTILKDNRPRHTGIHCDRCAALTLWPLGPVPGTIVGACPLCLSRPDEAIAPRKP